MLHPPPSPTHLRARKRIHLPFLPPGLLGGLCWMLDCVCPAAPTSALTVRAWARGKLFTAIPLPKQPLKQGAAPSSLSSPKAQYIFHFKIYLLKAFNLVLLYRHKIQLPYLTMSFEWCRIILQNSFLYFSHLCQEAIQILTHHQNILLSRFNVLLTFRKGPFKEKKNK